jgi:tetratricopeptide (TPR) repeat protein
MSVMRSALRAGAGVALGVVLALSTSRSARAASASEVAHRSLDECTRGRNATDRAERVRHFESGQALAEQAIALDDNLAAAHFGIVCNLGELLRVDGEKITNVFKLRRLLQEVDRTIALDPDHDDALATKGTLLVKLPRLLGGDVEKGEAMLRRVLELDPNALGTRLTLARCREAAGDRAEAVAFATRALQIAREQGCADKIAEAQAILAELGAQR